MAILAYIGLGREALSLQQVAMEVLLTSPLKTGYTEEAMPKLLKSLFRRFVLSRNFNNSRETRRDDEAVSEQDTVRRSNAVAAEVIKLQQKEIFQISSKGQIGLIVVLVMAVGLTIGLAIASQSLTDITVTETEEQTLRAFNAAEAGIESTLQQASLAGGTVTVGSGADALDAQVTVSDSTSQTIVLGRNETMEVPLTGGSATGVKISWVDKNDTIQCPGGSCSSCSEGAGNAPASLEIVRINIDESGGSQVIKPYRTLYNASTCASADLGGNSFVTASAGTDPFLSEETVAVDLDSGDSVYDTALRLRTFYNKATIKVEAVGGTLPVQSYQISSTATTDTGETRTIEVGRSVEAWPPIFDYVLFSGSNLSK